MRLISAGSLVRAQSGPPLPFSTFEGGLPIDFLTSEPAFSNRPVSPSCMISSLGSWFQSSNWSDVPPRREHQIRHQSDCSSTNVDQDIVRRGCARSDEGLMEFVADRKNSAYKPDRDQQERHFHGQMRAATQCAPKKNSKDRVLCQMRDLAHE